MEITTEQLMLLVEQLINDNQVGEITALDARTVFLRVIGKIDQQDVRLQAIADIANMGRDMAAANALKDGQQDTRLDDEEAATIRIDGEISTIKGMITAIMEGGPASGLTPADVTANAAERESNKQAAMANAMKILGLETRVGNLETNEATQNTAISTAQSTADGAKSTADGAASGLTTLMGRVGTNETDIDALQTKTDLTNERFDNLPSDTGISVSDKEELTAATAGVAENKQGLVDANIRIDGINQGSGVTQEQLEPQLEFIRETNANDFQRFGDVGEPLVLSQEFPEHEQRQSSQGNYIDTIILPPAPRGASTVGSTMSVDYTALLAQGSGQFGSFGNATISVSQGNIPLITNRGGVSGGSTLTFVLRNDGPVTISTFLRSQTNGFVTRATIQYMNARIQFLGDFVDPTNELIGEAVNANNITRDSALAGKVNPVVEAYVENNNVKSEPEDYITEAGSLPAQNPGNEFSGANGDDIAFGTFTLPTNTGLPGVSATREIQVSETYLYSGFRNQQGAESEFYYVVDQRYDAEPERFNRLLGGGSAQTESTIPTRQEIEANWIQIDNEYDELSFNSLVGSPTSSSLPPVVRFACIFTGEAGTFVPRLTGGKLSFIGRLRAPVAGVVHDELDDELMMLKDGVARVEGKADANTETGATNSAAIDAERDLIDGVRGTLAKPPFQVIDRAVVSQVESVTLDGTDLNTTLGGAGGLFARQLVSGSVGDAIRLTTKMTRASDVLVYGAGQVARVINSRVIGYELIEPQEEQRNDVEKYITDAQGFGSRTQPINLPFGVDGQNSDEERFVSVGYPESGAIVENIAFLFTTIINGNRAVLSTQLEFAPRSGSTVDFVVPGINGVTFFADDRSGSIRLRTRNTGAGGQVAANASLDIVIAYDETIVTPAVARGQRAIDLGAFTGNNIIGFDIGRVGNDAVNTLHIVTPTIRYNAGYFLTDAHRLEIDIDNMGFTFFSTIEGVPYTPQALAQLIPDDPYLGLFARTNHEADSFNLGTQLVIKQPDGKNVDVGARLQTLVPTDTGTVNEMRLGDAESKIETNISDISIEKGRNDDQDGLISRLRLDLTSTTSFANRAVTDSGNALTRANQAFDNAGTAQTAAETADGKADTAQATAETAQTSADTATATAGRAETNANTALATAGRAEEKADANTGAIATQQTAIDLNTAKVGLPDGLLERVAANDAKVGLPDDLLARVEANDAKVGITLNERQAINTATSVNNTQNQTLSAFETRIAANDLKPDAIAVRSIAGTAITEELAPNGAIRNELDVIVASGGGTTAQEKLDIATNNQKRSYTAEFQAVTDSNTIRITNHDLLFGARIVGDWESGDDLTFAPGITTLNIGDLVTQDGKVFEALESGLDDQTSADAPDANPSAWRDYSIQTMPYDDSALSGRVTTVESDVQTLKNNPVGNTLTPQEVAQALADNQATNPLHYNVKFSQDTTRQVAEQFRANVFDTQDLKNDSTDTSMVLKLLPDNTSVPNNVLNAIPFDSRWEGALRVATLDNGSGTDANRNTLLRVTREFKHFVGQVDEGGNSLEFTEYRRYIFRMTKEYAQDIPMNIFNTSVQLPENVTSDVRYTRLATQNIEINIIFELFGSQADITNGNPSARNTLPGAFNVDWDGVGVRYSQLAPVANTGDVYTDTMAKAQATEALAEGLATGGDIETAIAASSGAKASDLARGVFQLDLAGSGGTNFTIPLPTDTLPGETTLSGVLTIGSVGGFTPSGYTYNVRFSDGDRAVIFGNTTVPYNAAGTVINLVNYDISHGRPIEIDLAVNGGGGSTHPWTLALSVGSGEQGVLYGPTLDLINQQISENPGGGGGGGDVLDSLVLSNRALSITHPNFPTSGSITADETVIAPIPGLPQGRSTYRLSFQQRSLGTVSWSIRYTDTNQTILSGGNATASRSVVFDASRPISFFTAQFQSVGITGGVMLTVSAGDPQVPDSDLVLRIQDIIDRYALVGRE